MSKLVEAIATFKGADSNELSFEEGDRFILLEVDNSGWAKGIFNGLKGWFPEQYIQVIDENHDMNNQNNQNNENNEIVENVENDNVQNNEKIEENNSDNKVNTNIITNNNIIEETTTINPPVFDPSLPLPPPPPGYEQFTEITEKNLNEITERAPMKEAPKMEFEIRFEYDRPVATFEDLDQNIVQSKSYIFSFLNTAEKKDVIYNTLTTGKELLKTGSELQQKLINDLSHLLQEIIENEKIVPTKNVTKPPIPKNTLEQYRFWIKEYSKGKPPIFGINAACVLILKLAQQLGIPQKKPTKDQQKNLMPSSKKEPKNNTGAAHTFLLECIYDVLNENSKLGVNNYDLEVLDQIPQELILFCMDSLLFVHSKDVRTKAGECLGILSYKHFQFIKTKYFDLISACTKDESFRMLTTYQRALSYLNFGFEKEEQAKITLEVIFKLRDVSKKLSASAFRLAMCDSFLQILTPILKKRDNWILNTIEIANLQAAFTDFFDVVKKWFKKGKTKLGALKFLSLVFCNLPNGIINSKNEQLIPILTSGLSNKSIRQSHFDFLLDYFQTLPHSFVQSNYSIWEKQINAIMPYLLEKKQKNIEQVESKKTTAILIEMGKKDIKIIVHSHIKTVLTNDKEYSVETQGIVLNAIGVIYDTRNIEVDTSFTHELHPIITAKLEYFNQTINMFLSPVLFCFPYLCEHSKLGVISTKFIEFSASEDPELSVKGAQGLQNYLLMNNCENFEKIIFNMVYYLRKRICENHIKQEELSTHFRNLSLLFNTYLNKRVFENLKNVKSETWMEIRKNVEVCVLYCLMKQDKVLITDALTFLDLFCTDTFVRLDIGTISLNPYLNQYFNLNFWNSCTTKEVYYENFLKELSFPWLTELRFLWTSFFKTWDQNNKPLTNYFALTLDAIVNDKSQEFLKYREDFLKIILDNVTSSNASPVLSQSFDKLPISSFSEIFTIIASMRTEKEKKKSKEILHFETSILEIQKIIFSKLSITLFEETLIFSNSLKEYVEYWKENISSVSDSNKTKIINTLNKSFYLDGKRERPKFTEPEEMAKYNELLFTLITSQLSPIEDKQDKNSLKEKEKEKEKQNNSNPEDETKLHFSIFESLCSIIKYSMIHDSLLTNILTSIEQTIEHRSKYDLKDILIQCLALILNRFPKQYANFAFRSMDPSKPYSSHYFFAIIHTFKASTYDWITIVSIEKIFYLLMFHQCSTILETRKLSTEVTNYLANLYNVYSCGFLFPNSDFGNVEVYRRIAYQFSSALSQRMSSASLGIIKEFSASYKHLTVEYKQVMLKMMEPWIKNFGGILSNSENDATNFLSYMYSVSLESEYSVQNVLLEIFWQNVIVSGGASIRFLIHFLLSEYTKSINKVQLPVDIMMFIVRTQHDQDIVRELFSVLRSFEKIPENETELYQFFVESKKEKQHPYQKSAFKMFIQIAIEKSTLLIPYLTDILQNALILYNNQKIPFLESDGGHFIHHLVESCLFNKSSNQNLVDRSKEWINTHLVSLNDNFFGGGGLIELVKILTIYSEKADLQESLAQRSLEWAVGVLDTNLSYSSLKLFNLMNVSWSPKQTDKFIHSIYISLQFPIMNLPNLNTTQLYLSILHESLRNKNLQFSKEELDKLTQLVFHLLCTSSYTQYKDALLLAKEIKTRNENVSFAPFFSMWSERVDVFSTFMRGCTNNETCSLLLWFLKKIVTENAESDPSLFSNQLLLILTTKFTLSSDKEKNDALTFFSEFKGNFDFSRYSIIFTRPNLRIREISTKQFLKDFFATFAFQFPRYTHYVQLVDFFLIVLRNGDVSDRKFYWLMFEEFLNSYTAYNCKPEQMKLLSELCMFNSQELSHSSFKVLNFFIEKCHPNLIEKEIFKMKEVNPFFNIFAPKIDLLFSGDNGDDFKRNLYSCLIKFLPTLLRIDPSSQLALDLYSTFSQPLVFEGFTANLVVSQTPEKFSGDSKENPFKLETPGTLRKKPKKKDKKEEKERDKEKFPSKPEVLEVKPGEGEELVVTISKPNDDPNKPLSN